MKKHLSFYTLIIALSAMVCASSNLYANQASRIKDLSDSVSNIFGGKPTYWKVIQCDEKPSVDVGEYHGYRVVFEHAIMGPAVLRQREEMNKKVDMVVKGHDYLDLVLFPTSAVKHDIDKDKIPWLQLAQTFYSRAFYMGKGHGYHWFANTTVYYQDIIRTSLYLSGGEDRLPILFSALDVVDQGYCTAASVGALLQHVGVEDLPYIRKSIDEHMSDIPGRYISVLGYIPGDEATNLLQSLYASDNKKLADAVAHTLINKPFREAAKPQYLDMLKKDKYINEICKACIKFGWKEAVPELERLVSTPQKGYSYRNVYETLRTLQNKPVSNTLKEAEKTIMGLGNTDTPLPSPEEIEQAKKTILTTDDKPYAAMIAALLAIYNTKANTKPVQETGLELLRSMPREDIQPMIQVLKIYYESDKWNSFIKRVLDEFDTTKQSASRKIILADVRQKIIEYYHDTDVQAKQYVGVNSLEFAKARKQFIVPLLNALKLILDNEVPKSSDAFDIPGVDKYDVPECSPGREAIVKKHAEQIEAHEIAIQMQELIAMRSSLVKNIAGWYLQKPYATDELHQIASDILKNDDAVIEIMKEAETNMKPPVPSS